MTSLKQKTVSALIWSSVDRFGQQGVQFIISIILARLLEPKEFGIIAMLSIFMAIAQVFIESGFGSALIQKKDANHIDESSIFYFNIAVGIIMAGILCITAPLISDFYKVPILTKITRVLSLSIIINSFGSIQINILIKKLNFKKQAKISIIAVSLSGIVGIICAYRGLGVWSLAIYSVLGNFLRVSLLWLSNIWRPLFAFSLNSLKTMFSFGSKLLLSGLLSQMVGNLYYAVIGKLYSPADLGFYSRARSLQQRPISSIMSVFGRVMFPAFSKVQDEKYILKEGAKKTLKVYSFIIFPIMIGIIASAKILIVVLITDKWLPCTDYLRLLCIIGMISPISSVNLNILNALGRSDLFLKIEIFKVTMIFIAIVITYRFGIIYMIMGHLILCSIPAIFINSYFTGKFIKYNIWEQLSDIAPYLCCSIIMGISVFMINFIPISSNIAILFSQIIVGIISYLVASRVFRLFALYEIINVSKSYINRLESRRFNSIQRFKNNNK